MALFQSDWAKGLKNTPFADCAGDVIAEKFKFTVTSNIAANDIIEIGGLPALHEVVDAVLIVDEAGTATYDVGIMSGEYGVNDAARTCGNEFFAGAADAQATRMSKVAGWRVGATDKHRGIGVKVLGAGITAASQVIELVLFYKA